jgi:transcriptional regulator GlxA family with amidase domain
MARDEFGQPGSLLSHATGRAAFEEMLALALLHGLQHSHSALLAAPAAAPAPRHLHRAESFLRANLDRIITLEAVAAAAGCSIRTLQQAFRQWRDTTPMAAWRDLRLDAAHAALSRREPELSVEAVARQFYFFNRNRFAQGYRRRHGEYPTQTRGAGNAEP